MSTSFSGSVSLAHNAQGDHIGGAARGAQLVRVKTFRQLRTAGIHQKVRQAFFVILTSAETMHSHLKAFTDHHWRIQVAFEHADGEEIVCILGIIEYPGTGREHFYFAKRGH
jgi:hypothetical protein